jgi:hypothetical protein
MVCGGEETGIVYMGLGLKAKGIWRCGRGCL